MKKGATNVDVIRDPIYGPVSLDSTARSLIDTPAFQRLRRIKQLSMASEVYPSAMHTRFEHALGVYHLGGRIVDQMQLRGELDGMDPDDLLLIRYACLLHDLGHFSGAHLLEEVNYPGACHEVAGSDWFNKGEIGRILRGTGIPDAANRLADLVTKNSAHPLSGIVSGDCDADKMDYLVRDAYHCGLPQVYDQAHLSSMLVLVKHPATGQAEIGLDIRGLPSFEAMLYAKFNLYRAVYFHPASRSATAMMRALLVNALDSGLCTMEELHQWTDDEIFTLLRHRVINKKRPHARQVRLLTERLLGRALYKASASLPLSAAPAQLDHAALTFAERSLEKSLGLAMGEAILDVPRKETMLSTNLLVRRPDGTIEFASSLGPDDGFALNTTRDTFYAASGRIHLFTPERIVVPEGLLQHALSSSHASHKPAIATSPKVQDLASFGQQNDLSSGPVSPLALKSY